MRLLIAAAIVLGGISFAMPVQADFVCVPTEKVCVTASATDPLEVCINSYARCFSGFAGIGYFECSPQGDLGCLLTFRPDPFFCVMEGNPPDYDQHEFVCVP